ncbi:erythrocyte membrane protein 1 [Plasmodium falciparum IGH-CR14]|uniref:Erythrocyte membrane protein 1 n=1 Tax=Plasmodium falciparum IGH-CR14 TaxID=580059 RepID=A0A0L1IAQ4_PLAFA|nr:erythrocyte membrane protein 1 [Plasmodium falciparum IGH-CR14]
MRPPAQGSRQRGKKEDTPNYKDAQDAKHLLDMIGETVHKKVRGDALPYNDALQGRLKQVTYPKDERPTDSTSSNPCELNYKYHTNVTSTVIDPCNKRSRERFSEVSGAECDEKKIKDSKGGACAPFRRLHLCDKNIQQIKTENITTHNLLADVCQAAKFEGQSITREYPKYIATYNDSPSKMCTMLARSFADIGDIVRGKDLYLGYNRKEKAQKEKLENKLKEYFENIHDKLEQPAKEHYGSDKENYYQLREDWWALNRQEIWKAITCERPGGTYFRKTCVWENETQNNCRCTTHDVPTYFDYVPQYLRWFEEWAEDFCRKRKHKLQNAKEQCREGEDQSGGERYCDFNGYDCKGTASGKHKYLWDYKCAGCFFWCSDFRKWMKNQQKEFDKQVKKYGTEISGAVGGVSSRQRRAVGGETATNYEEYESKFYKILKDDYENVDAFLEKLSKEGICQSQPQVEDEKASSVNFTNGHSNKTFSHTEICEPCPWCGVNGTKGNWERIDDHNACKEEELYTPKNNVNPTKINVLTSGEGREDIAKRLNAFCQTQNGGGGSGYCGGTNSDSSLCEPWQCYEFKDLQKDGQDVGEDDNLKGAGGLCILEKTNSEENGKKQKTFNNFFNFWVAHVLKDSIEWREKLGKCLENGKKTCKNKQCRKNCECYESWVKQKGEEWKLIEPHYKKQDFGQGWTPYNVLEWNLQYDYFPSIVKAYPGVKFVEEIKKKNIIDENINHILNATRDDNSIDKLLLYEKEIAETCKEKNPEKCPEDTAGGRSLVTQRGPTVDSETNVQPADPKDTDHDSSDEDDEDDDSSDDHVQELETEENEAEPAKEEEEESQEPDKGPQQEEEKGPKVKVDTKLDVCATVATALKGDKSLNAACALKYVTGKNYGWRCVAPSGTTSGGKDGATGGSICVPPRRRKLYIGKLEQWANSSGSDTQARGSEPQVGEASQQQEQQQQQQQQQQQTHSTDSSSTTPTSNSRDDDLRNAFIQSAAVETFFLWHKYKADKQKEIAEKKKRELEENGELPFTFATESSGDMKALPGAAAQAPQLTSKNSDDPNDPNNIYSGKIPPDFLRQMFYTLADYKDILYSGSNDNTKSSTYNDIISGDKEMKAKEEKVKKAIQEFFQNGDSKPASDKDPESWWNNNAKHIWHGMICALTYEEKDAKGQSAKIEQNEDLKEKLLDKDGNKPKEDGNYTYEKVELKDEKSETRPKPQNPATSSDTPLLSEFVLRPPYFRYLEEWGETFCRERKKRLDQIYKDCYKNGERCSGDGLECNDPVPKNEEIFGDFDCSTCARHCRFYKKWIDIKKKEFDKQSNAYGQQKENYVNGNNKGGGDNGFCTKLKENYTDAASFLNRLKSGPCKKDNGESNGNDHEEDEIKFDEKHKTFKHTQYCDPCSKFKINCKENGNCKRDTENKCDGKTPIDAKQIEQMKNSTPDVVMRVSDNDTSTFEGDDLKVCEGKGIFKGISEDVWKCGEYCGVHVCTLKKNVNNGKGDEKPIIMKELLQRWLEYFFEDYNKINKKLKTCTKSENKSTCIKGCVEKWIDKKKEEWKNINNNYLEQYTKDNESSSNDLYSFLEQAPFHDEVNKAIKPCSDLHQFEESRHCNGAANTEKVKDGNKSYVIDCMLNKLQQKATSCAEAHKENSVQTCSPAPRETPDDEEDLTLEETEENPEEAKKNMMPTICEDMVPQEPEAEVEDGCKPARAPSADTKSDQPPPAIPTPAAPIPQPQPQPPPQADEPFNRDILEKTIPFGVALALGSIAFLFLKKKTKSTIDLLRVINIPKSDYNIPTKLSPNRYIPYTSGKYRGKRYIYLEGDSGTDSGYTDHYSDITSSSESEYEELDINDIYVPGSPKYKTLIEVVLEPSGNNTTGSGKNTPSDTQNDIQNDGIPSSKITDNEWNQLKYEFISQYLQSEQPNDIPNDYKSGNSSTNTNITTMSRHTLDQKPFITSIHDRNLYSGEEYSYNVNMVNSMDDIPINRDNNVYSGIDLINDTLSGNQHIDIYDELLKRKENELFGTNHVKHTSTHSVAKPARDDPIHNQLELFHKWLDRHRDMCEQWNNKEELLDKLKEEWNKDNNNNSGTPSDNTTPTTGITPPTSDNTPPTTGNTPPTSDIPSGKLSDTPSDNNIHSDIHSSDIPSGKQSDIPSDNNIHSDIPYVLNTDVSIQIDMDNPKPINEFTNMDTYPENSTMDSILEDLDKYNEPYYDVQDDIYYDVNDHDTSTVDSNNMDVPSKVQIEMDVNTKLVKEKYPIADVWDI